MTYLCASISSSSERRGPGIDWASLCEAKTQRECRNYWKTQFGNSSSETVSKWRRGNRRRWGRDEGSGKEPGWSGMSGFVYSSCISWNSKFHKQKPLWLRVPSGFYCGQNAIWQRRLSRSVILCLWICMSCVINHHGWQTSGVVCFCAPFIVFAVGLYGWLVMFIHFSRCIMGRMHRSQQGMA